MERGRTYKKVLRTQEMTKAWKKCYSRDFSTEFLKLTVTRLKSSCLTKNEFNTFCLLLERNDVLASFIYSALWYIKKRLSLKKALHLNLFIVFYKNKGTGFCFQLEKFQQHQRLYISSLIINHLMESLLLLFLRYYLKTKTLHLIHR